ncbi:MAG: homoserine dehydrogenase [Planctomycetaceae bacterium]|nr:homoserine dehydrogenase [Planctomycetaceae bacterium]
MSASKRCGIGLAGAGVVGVGVADLLLERRELLAGRSGVDIDLAWVADMDTDRAINLGVPREKTVDDFRKLMDKPDVDVVVELMGGTGVAYDCVMAALDAGKHVVTANKALLAERGAPIFAKAREKNRIVAFEAAVAGGIPLLLSLREGLIANRMQSLVGIVNGTCNYILTEMTAKGISFDECLKEAQRLGFAEADPSSDIDGKDSGHKLALLSALAFEMWVDFPTLHIEGIRGISDVDIAITRSLGYTLKLLGVIRTDPEPLAAEKGGKGEVGKPGRLFLSVHPGLLRNADPLAAVAGSMNGVRTEGDAVMESMFYGRGAGRYPTASAVVSDIVAVARASAYGGIGPRWYPPQQNAYNMAPIEDYEARYYLRCVVKDKPGVLGRITTELGANNVSIAAVHQFESDLVGGNASLCIITQTAREGDMRDSVRNITTMDFLEGAPTLLRIEE